MRSKGTLETTSYRLEDDALGSHSASSIARDRFESLENPKREGPRGRYARGNTREANSKFRIDIPSLLQRIIFVQHLSAGRFTMATLTL